MPETATSPEQTRSEIAGLLASIKANREEHTEAATAGASNARGLLGSILTLLDAGLMSRQEAEASAVKVMAEHIRLLEEERDRLQLVVKEVASGRDLPPNE